MVLLIVIVNGGMHYHDCVTVHCLNSWVFYSTTCVTESRSSTFTNAAASVVYDLVGKSRVCSVVCYFKFKWITHM